MKSSRTKQLFFALAALLLASLACSLVESPHPTEQPKATSAAVSSPEPTQAPASKLGEVILEENFADNSNKWYVNSDKDKESVIENGKYKIRVLVPDNSFYWFVPPVQVSDVDLTVDAEFAEGAPENAAYGFICHFKDGDNFYRFRVAPDGTYSIDKSVNAETSALVDWTSTSAANPGIGATNKIHAICSESHLILYINDTFIADVIDTSLSGGSFNLVVGAYTNKKDDKNPIGINFSNLIARKPQAWERSTGSILSDTFDDNKNNWDLFQEKDGSAQIENGQMTMKVKAVNSIYRVWSQISLSNVDISFDAVIQDGTQSNVSYGAACRYVNVDNYYSFSVDGDGYYTLKKKVKGTLEVLTDWTTSSAIKTGVGETNHIRVVCSDSKLELYANDQLLVSSQDTSLTSGSFTLQTGRFEKDDKPMSVTFDNVEVKYPEK